MQKFQLFTILYLILNAAPGFNSHATRPRDVTEARDECHSDNLRSKILTFGSVADIGTTGVFFRQNQFLTTCPTTTAP
jgi:hypothetical protein